MDQAPAQSGPPEEVARLVSAGHLRVQSSIPLGARAWEPGWMPTYDRWAGMFLGQAIGDALGNTSEGVSPPRRMAMLGEISNYRSHHDVGGQPRGMPSDDTQLCAWAVEQILNDGRFDPDRYQALIAERRILGEGQTVRKALGRRREGMAWYQAAQDSAGNGALMRCPGVLPAHIGSDGSNLAADAALFAAVTHNNLAAISSAVAFTQMLVDLMAMDGPPAPRWWTERYVALAKPLEGPLSRLATRSTNVQMQFDGPLWSFVSERVSAAVNSSHTTLELCESWHSGAYLLETLPCALLILARHAGDPEDAMVQAVNDTRDNDTIGAIVGSAVGALHGLQALPDRWREGLSGRTQDNDDGRLFDLVQSAYAAGENRRSEV